MIHEWWNLDQALIWIETRNEELVQEAGGHPSNERARDGSWLLRRLSIADIRSSFPSIFDQIKLSKKLVVNHRKITESDARVWEGILFDRLLDGLLPCIDVAEAFSPIHPAWFIGAYVSSSQGSSVPLDRVPIAKFCRSMDGEDPKSGLIQSKAVLIDTNKLCEIFPEEWDAVNLPPELLKKHSNDKQLSNRGGRPPVHEGALLVSIAAAIVYEGPVPKKKAELVEKSLTEYALRQRGKGYPSEQWAKPLIACLWDELGLTEARKS